MTTGHYILIGACLLAMAGMFWSLRRDAKRRAAQAHADRVGWVKSMRDAGFTELRRFAIMQRYGVTEKEIAQAEEDA